MISPNFTAPSDASQSEQISHLIEKAAHYLPTQGPITAFVHHNTLHAFEDLDFESAVMVGLEKYGCEPYLPKTTYRDAINTGRIRFEDVESIILDDLGEEADRLVASFGTRFALRSAMLRYPIRIARANELQWLITESDALRTFRDEVPGEIRKGLIEQTKRWYLRNENAKSSGCEPSFAVAEEIAMEMGTSPSSWSAKAWEAFVLRFLWRACLDGVASIRGSRGDAAFNDVEPRTKFYLASADKAAGLVDEILIRFCAAFLDQGMAQRRLPNVDEGFLAAFIELHGRARPFGPGWMQGLAEELQSLKKRAVSAIDSIADSLKQTGIPPAEYGLAIERCLLRLRGWAGILWQMETAAPWMPHPSPAGTLNEYLAVRLLLERFATRWLAKHGQPISRADSSNRSDPTSQLAFVLFQIAQAQGWTPEQLTHLSSFEWQQLVQEVDAFGSFDRRRILHLAYEKRYRDAALNALLLHNRGDGSGNPTHATEIPAYQIVTCIDDREESFRRHLEEVEPRCETYGLAGFFAVAMYYQGENQAHFQPLCPNNIVPKHYVREEPVFSASGASQTRSYRRRVLGALSHQVHSGSRTLLGGVLTGLLGTLATGPLVARVMAPRLTAKFRKRMGMLVDSPPTELHIERMATEPGSDYEALGFSIDEMAAIVVRALEDIGLTKNFAPIVLFVGHGSGSLNNPHESAYNCGACSGGRGGPNARAFAAMANDARVRKVLVTRGIDIPEDVRFLGAYHNTCNDSVEFFDLDLLPRTHRELFRKLEADIIEARRRNAQERSRRFRSCPKNVTPAQALQHVEHRAEDLSQARPEYNHATNAMCIVGGRDISRGLFLDRRSFLASYDPTQDTTDAIKLARILAPVIPVCAGISLEYYFSTVDSEGYGCGSKLPHNIVALTGVMTGAASDLRPGLSAQMVEIHEPMRILFVVETTIGNMQRVLDGNPVNAKLVDNRWVQLAVLDRSGPEPRVYLRENGKFRQHLLSQIELPQVARSSDWFVGHDGHLEFAEIRSAVSEVTRDMQRGVQ